MTAPADRWNPGQYEKFRTERMQPFFDLVDLVRPRPGMRVIDIGCGTGELAIMLAERLPGATVEGIDTSPAMLAEAALRATDRVSFHHGDAAAPRDYSIYDLIFSNAVWQWVPDNAGLLSRMLASMKPGAQIVVQVPKNDRHPSHALAGLLAREEPFRSALDGFDRRSEALSLEEYASLLYSHGVREMVCIEKIYGHVLENTRAVVEWVKGTSLNAYLSRLSPDLRDVFLERFTGRLLDAVGDHSPYFYPFRRLLFWGQIPA